MIENGEMNHVALQLGHNRRDDSRNDEDSGLQGMEVEVDLNNEDMEEDDEEELEESYSATVIDANKMQSEKKVDGDDCDEEDNKIYS